MHELGHNLCLSNVVDYASQANACIYSGIDNPGSSVDYVSSMNYSYQTTMTNYSSGPNGTINDHNDWAAVASGINDFADTSRNAGDSLLHGTNVKMFRRAATIEEAKGHKVVKN